MKCIVCIAECIMYRKQFYTYSTLTIVWCTVGSSIEPHCISWCQVSEDEEVATPVSEIPNSHFHTSSNQFYIILFFILISVTTSTLSSREKSKLSFTSLHLFMLTRSVGLLAAIKSPELCFVLIGITIFPSLSVLFLFYIPPQMALGWHWQFSKINSKSSRFK